MVAEVSRVHHARLLGLHLISAELSQTFRLWRAIERYVVGFL